MPVGLLGNLSKVRKARSGRASSWDQTGRNQDYWLISPGESVVLADIEGPGSIVHIWMTQFCRRILGPGLIDPVQGNYVAPVFEIHNALGLNWEAVDPFYYRKVLLKIYWDDQDTPSVLTPLGDFFCIGHSIPGNFAALPITVSTKPEERYTFGGSAAVNCYFPMPFNKRAKVVVENQNDVPYGQYFYIDYELYKEQLPSDTVYFHAHWQRENPNHGWGPQLQVNSPETNVANLSAKDNYVVLETEGEGHYVGCNLSVTHFQGSWWGEGDDMIFIDGDTWPPSLHGTGTEDYFNHAWGMQNNGFLFNGSALHESIIPGYQTSYRFHILDPIHFSRCIRVTFEHGHSNHLSDDWSSTAYWYQKLPSKKFEILPLEQRLPIVIKGAPVIPMATPAKKMMLTDEMKQNIEIARRREEEYVERRNQEVAKKLEKTRRASLGNIEQVRAVRRSFNKD
ncbi:MAG: DUF2961 domain-containing protein [Anaerolineae bacterium]|nr:DUF2961 domain-containing protein [Anaerolineae bacterium]